MIYYNENDPKAAAWLRALILAGVIPGGHIDTRSIVDVKPEDLTPYTTCHFFAGIGGWAYALRLAGWPDDLPVDTGSCPCQPFSCAGKGKGTRDKRHLWPVWARLIAKRRPPVIFGEQVASKAGRLWLSRIRAEMETLGYAVGAADLCAAGVSAPMVSQRLHWVAEASRSERRPPAEGRRHVIDRQNSGRQETASGCPVRGEENPRVAQANSYHSHWWSGPLQVGWNCIESEIERGGRKHRAQWRTQPGVPLLADGVPGRVAQLCGFGNAIVPQLAAEFISAYLQSKPGP